MTKGAPFFELIFGFVVRIYCFYLWSFEEVFNNINSNNSISLPREDAYICLQKSYISVDFEVLKNDDTTYTDSDQISLINFRPVALFSEAKLTTSSGKKWINYTR